MKKKTILFSLAALLICLAGCEPQQQEPQKTWQQSLAETAELGTVEYTVKKIVKANDKQWYTLGERHILFQTTAYIKAGVKVDKFSDEDVAIDADNNITITLPHSQVLSFNMPADEIVTVFEDYGFFRSKFNAEEQNYILQLGESDIRAFIPETGILQDAENNARLMLTALLKPMKFKNDL